MSLFLQFQALFFTMQTWCMVVWRGPSFTSSFHPFGITFFCFWRSSLWAFTLIFRRSMLLNHNFFFRSRHVRCVVIHMGCVGSIFHFQGGVVGVQFPSGWLWYVHCFWLSPPCRWIWNWFKRLCFLICQ